jgi:hypothetical protein
MLDPRKFVGEQSNDLCICPPGRKLNNYSFANVFTPLASPLHPKV